MSAKMIIVRCLALAVIASFIMSPVMAKEKVTDAKNKAFYSQLSCKASTRAVVALAASLEAKGVSQLDINKAIIEVLQGTSLSPNGPRWTCCRACVENDLPNDSAACQCCDGLGDQIIDISDVD
ncbi:hypothetical protein SAMN05216302_100727 [Nitrosomonas aestuarii]|uniref:Uncharacterized protein n=1 Tax=Nitrosomonas aestuarii TaxID=52441 RepID=A0A1I3ZS15_9PROT|nr:hypothetical protein [Nitrosomonas aestuarii]SFK46737.1 hypothetical protein SAMN05216302_100727 [Nitrosomonas aestuarii]